MSMRYYAVIDTNVLVSALLKWDSVPGNIISLIFDGPIIPLLEERIVREYREVLMRPKFHLTEEVINDVLDGMIRKGTFVDAEPTSIDLPDPKDQVFYEVVMEERKKEDAYLVTGNIKHFPVRRYIVTPKEMLDIILADAKE